MPFAIYILGLAVFAQGTSEFMLSGLLPGIAADLGVSVSAAGALTSAFAAGMIVGAPLMAVLSMRWPRRLALLVFLVAFMLVHVVGAITPSFSVLLVTRVLGALATAGFLAVGIATATGMVAPDAKGRATSVLLGGVTLACVAGVPAGAVLGQALGWRAAFWAVALISLPAVFAVLRLVPGAVRADADVPHAARPSAGRELRALRRPRLLVVLLLGALVNGATFCTFTYLAPLVVGVSGFSEGWVPALLALFGAGSFAGVTISGRLSDTRPMWVLIPGGIALLAGWALFAVTAHNPVAALVLALVQGTLSFAVGSTLIAQVLYAAVEAPSLGGSFATVALNVGAAAGPALGGLAMAAGSGYRAPLWVSAALVAAALVTAALAEAVRRLRSTRREVADVTA
ncbi:DHA1 family chloramphenicol resistance protein-like MFS transporter [Nonomuraea thailandensis]|uniref:DHA1 family chloramphenicol resistance protein-like MFS transporter n=1 Tax=Nonomuraea thailandensis TaxID=1188745 RepID=A0A9X2GCA7_9ACTN|nr:Cmx/CmrA family chloramphenicol efflux MFS transporter [Nonomuraea thailandensis]MCP2356519.1 DHA1 family chloramphenicol resistance protein-like MFS transporter [Nonomuraea thailandensis]